MSDAARRHRPDRRALLALLGLVPLAGCWVGGLPPPIDARFAAIDIRGDDLVADLDPRERAHVLDTARLAVADEFRRAVVPGDPTLPTLEVAISAITLADAAPPRLRPRYARTRP